MSLFMNFFFSLETISCHYHSTEHTLGNTTTKPPYVNNKNLLYNRGNYTQHLVITYKGKESKKNRFYIYIYESLCCTPKTNATL